MKTNCVIILLFVHCLIASAQWQPDGVAVCDTMPNQSIFTLPKIASDAAGGVYICWRDVRDGNFDIYAQRVDSSGRVMWQRNGIAIVKDPAHQDFPRLTDDGNEGAFIAWEDDRSVTNTFVYAQRVSRNGLALWETNGVKVSERSGLFISIANDEHGGLLIGWISGGVYDVFVQRLDNSGTRMWGDSGVQVTNRAGNISSNDVRVTPDGVGGAIVAWAEAGRIYVQRVDAMGETRWETNGLLLSDTTKSAAAVGISSDTRGGAIIDWGYQDGTAGVQRVGYDGQVLWDLGGVALPRPSASGGRSRTGDHKGGAFVGHGSNIHHLDSTGTRRWGDNGALFITTSGATNSAQAFDGNRGVFNFSEFFKDGEGWFVLAQWIDETGAPRFGADGKKITPGIPTQGRQFWPAAIGDNRGAAIVCWNDNRSNTSAVYVARIDTNGVITKVPLEGSRIPTTHHLDQNYPNPFNAQTTISFFLPRSSHTVLKVRDLLGREISTLLNGERESGEHRITFSGEQIPSGVYFYTLEANEFVITKKMLLLR